MTFPLAPQKVADFYGTAPPTPGEIGAQLDEISRSIREILGFLGEIARTDGKIKNAAIGLEQISPEIARKVAHDAANAVEIALSALRADVSRVLNAKIDVFAALDEVRALKREVFGDLAAISALKDDFRRKLEHVERYALTLSPNSPVSRVLPPKDPNLNPDMPVLTGEFAPGVGAAPDFKTQYSGPPAGVPNVAGSTDGDPRYTGVLYPQAGGFAGAGQDAGAVAVSADYAQVSIEWAEHMPDPIPANILAVTGVTGQHWSSRWWAAKANEAFGGIAGWYLGPNAIPPSTTPTGNPLIEGMMYFDTVQDEMFVWNGTEWQPFGAPAASFTSTLYYQMAANQTLIDLKTPDIFNNTASLMTGQGLNVYLGGRLTPVRQYTVNEAQSTITLVQPAAAGVYCAVDLLILSSHLAPTAVQVKRLNPLAPPFNGAITAFTLSCFDGSAIVVTNPVQLLISLDGVTQEAGVAFTASGNIITFAAAPQADSYFFGVWLVPGGGSS
jgi:hypothetical protein